MNLAKVKQHFAEPTDQALETYRALRKAIGILGLALPWAVWLVAAWLFHQPRQASISAFYYTGAHDLFVGILWAIGVFLLFYQGPEKRDFWVSTGAGLCAIGVALFPTAPASGPSALECAVSNWHISFASVFFLLITGMTLFLFTRSAALTPIDRGKRGIYIACGLVMFGCVGTLLVRHLMAHAACGDPGAKSDPIVYWLELIAIEAFGVAWLVKGT